LGGVFSGLEGSLEKYIEGFFKDKLGGGYVQPVEIAKKLAREMRDSRRVSVSCIYVPNEYTVHLHPSDYENITNFSGLLAKELQEYVRQKAEEKRYTLAGRPLVSFACDENLAGGSVRLESRFSESPPEAEKTPEENSIEHTQRFTLLKEAIKTDTAPLVYGRLVIDAGPDRGKTFNLSNVSIVIGRREDCGIILNDTSISRRHARLELSQGRYVITDIGSTNGVVVNGEKILTKVLEPGDVLTLGTTVCTFKVE